MPLEGLMRIFLPTWRKLTSAGSFTGTNQSVYYCGKSTIYHVGAGTLGYGNPRKIFLNFRNGLALIYKHFTAREILYKLPMRMLLDWVAALIFLLKGESRNCSAVFQAHVAFLKGLGTSRQKRREIQTKYPNYPRDTIKRGLIVFDYYIRGKKKPTLVIPNRIALAQMLPHIHDKRQGKID